MAKAKPTILIFACSCCLFRLSSHPLLKNQGKIILSLYRRDRLCSHITHFPCGSKRLELTDSVTLADSEHNNVTLFPLFRQGSAGAIIIWILFLCFSVDCVPRCILKRERERRAHLTYAHADMYHGCMSVRCAGRPGKPLLFVFALSG